ncbi:MAG: DUF4919 domain-containing protein [Acidobacteriota bacterium]
MRRKFVGLGLLLLLSAVSVLAQTQPAPTPTSTPTPTPTSAVVEKKSYDLLLERAKKGDPALDFTALRLAFYESPHYNPNVPMMTYRPLWGAVAQKNYPEAIKIAQSVLEKNFVEVNAHMVAQIAYRETGDVERAQFHKYVADGLLNSIKAKGDGKNIETAYEVISINEEYGLMRSMELRPIKQALIPDKEHFFDAITVIDPQTNQQRLIYFNVDKVFAFAARKKN